jgi:hydrogenase maturation protease
MTTERTSAGQTDRGGGSTSPDLVIVGVGNRIRGDDGIGPTVIERLKGGQAGDAEEIHLVDAGTTGFLALEAMSGAQRAIVVDAVQTGASPGTIREYRCVDGNFETEIPEMTMHDVSFTEAMVAGRAVYDLPDDILILGVEPADISIGDELSEPAEQAAAELVELLTERRDELSTIAMPTDPTSAETEP